jgi:hypothetical protein
MPIVTADLKLKLSIKTGTAGNQSAQPDVNASLGKYISTTEVVDNTINNLFDNISGDENVASTVDYRCVFVHNSHATLTLQGTKLWLSAEVAGGAAVALAVDDVVASAVGSASAQAAEIANETTAPTGVGAFSSPTTKAGGLTLGDIGPGQVKAFWVRRTAANTVAVNNDGATIRFEGDTGA